jgi:hypothetical protein
VVKDIIVTNTFTKELYNKKVYGNSGNTDVLEQIPEKAKTLLDVGCIIRLHSEK